MKWTVILALLGALAVHPAAAAQLDAQAQQRLGLQRATLRTRTLHTTLEATADVLDPVSLAHQLGRVQAARAAAEASAAELRRTRALLAAHGNASRKALEAARAQQAADRASMRDARSALRMQWGESLAELPSDRRETLLDALLDGHAALLAAEPMRAPPQGFAPERAHVDLADGHAVPAKVLGRLPNSRSGLAPGWLLQTDVPGLAPGMALTARLEDDTRTVHGTWLPDAAIVRWNGRSWAYVAIDATHFERRPVTPLAVRPQGWLVGAPFRGGEQVVVRGAEALIAVDAASAPGSEPEDGDDD